MKNYPIKITAKDRTKSAFNSISKNLKGLGSIATKVSGIFGGLSVAGLAATVNQSAEAAKEIKNLSRVAGVAGEDFQRLAFGADNFGISQEKLADILKDTNDKLGDFAETGGGAMADFFENIGPKVGVTIESFRNLSSDQALGLYVSSLEKANVSQQDMTFYLEAIASDSTALLPLLRDNGAAMDRFAEEADKLGIVLSEIELTQLAEAQKGFQKTKSVLKAFGDQLAVRFIPLVNDLAEKFLGAAQEAGGLGNVAGKVAKVVMKAVGVMINGVHGLKVVWAGLKALVIGVFSGIVDKIAATDRVLTKFINKFTPMTKEVNHDLTLMSARLMLASEKATGEFNRLLNADLPSKGLDAWFEKVTVKSQKAAAKINEVNKGLALPGDSGGGDNKEEEETALDRFIEKNRIAAKDYEKIWVGGFDTFKNGAAGAVADTIVEQKNLADGLQGVMRSVAKSVIAGLVKIGIQKAALWAAEKVGLATSTAANVTAGAATTAAWTPAAAATSVASFGANIPMALAGLAAVFATSKALAGVAHDGLPQVPTDGTYLLQKGEKVVNNRDSKKLDAMLDGKAGGDNVTVNINLNALDSKSGHEYLKSMSGTVSMIVREELNNRGRAF